MNPVDLLQAGEPRKALPILRNLVKKDHSYQNQVNLCSALRGCGLLDEAMEGAASLMKQFPKSPEVWNNAAQIVSDLGKFGDAVKLFQHAVELIDSSKVEMKTPSVQNVMLGFAYSLMRFAMFKEAFPLFEFSRMGNTWHTLPGIPMWKGEPRRSLLVVWEGGYGDLMLFCRYLYACSKRCEFVSILVPDQMVKWCDWHALGVSDTVYHSKRASEGFAPVRGVLPMSKAITPDAFDCMISIMSLPSIVGLQGDFAAVPGYPFPELMFGKLEGFGHAAGNQIGFCWKAEESGTVRPIRSLDHHAATVIAKRLAKHGPVYSLCPLEKKAPAGVSEVPLDDWRATTEFMAGLDYVVTVDTAVAHLAGILRIPTLLLLPLRSDWKYFLQRSHGPWYGEQLRYFRNSNPVTWELDKIKTAISQLIESKG